MGFWRRMRYILQCLGRAPLFRRLVIAALLVTLSLPLTSPVRAAFATGSIASDYAVEVRDGVTDAFVSRLLDEINARRDAVGTPRSTSFWPSWRPG